MAEAQMKAAYEKIMTESTEKLTGHMCFPVDWFPEPMPIENSEGMSIYTLAESMQNPFSHIGKQGHPYVGEEVVPWDILCFSDSYGFCKELFACAPPGRIGTLEMQTKPIDKYNQKDVAALISSKNWDLILFGAGIDLPPTSKVEDVHKTQTSVTRMYLWMLQQIVRDARWCKHLCVLTCDIFAEEAEIHEECGLGLITNATLFGMTNTARQEIDPPIQFIDTEWALAPENMPMLMSEVFREATFGINSVRILNRGRYVLRQVLSTRYEIANKGELILPEEGIIAISGGNGALALVMGTWLMNKAEQQGGNLKFEVEFLSRSMKISDQNQYLWDEISEKAEKLGIKVSQAKMDMATQEGVDEYISKVTPNLKGFIHSAGILQDSMLMNQTWEKFDAVFDSKNRAATFLHDSLERFENPDLDFLWVFSSAAVWGNMGQLNYSASNSFLDALMRHRQAMGKPGQAPQWGAWGDVGMARNLDDASRRRMTNSPMPYFTNAEGLYGLEQGIRSGLPYYTVHKINPPLMFGMIMGEGPPIQMYQRNFTSEMAPPPPTWNTGTPNGVYSVLRPYISAGLSPHKGLVFQAYCPGVAKKMAADLDDEE